MNFNIKNIEDWRQDDLNGFWEAEFTSFKNCAFTTDRFKISFERKVAYDNGKEVMFLEVNIHDDQSFNIFKAIVLDRRKIFSQKAQKLIMTGIHDVLVAHSNMKEKFEKIGMSFFKINEKGYDVMKAENEDFNFIASRKVNVLEMFLKENPPYGNSRIIFFPFVLSTKTSDNFTKFTHELYGFDLFSYVLDFHKWALEKVPKFKMDFLSLNQGLRDEILMFEGRKLIEKDGLFQYHRRVWDRYFQRNAWI